MSSPFVFGNFKNGINTIFNYFQKPTNQTLVEMVKKWVENSTKTGVSRSVFGKNLMMIPNRMEGYLIMEGKDEYIYW